MGNVLLLVIGGLLLILLGFWIGQDKARFDVETKLSRDCQIQYFLPSPEARDGD